MTDSRWIGVRCDDCGGQACAYSAGCDLCSDCYDDRLAFERGCDELRDSLAAEWLARIVADASPLALDAMEDVLDGRHGAG